MAKLYIRKVGNRWQYRRKIPKSLLPYFDGQTTINRNFNTDSEKMARQYAIVYNIDIENMFDDMKAKLQDVVENTVVSVTVKIDHVPTVLTNNPKQSLSPPTQPHIPDFKKTPQPNKYSNVHSSLVLSLPDQTTLQTLIDDFTKHCKSKNQWSKTTAVENERMLKLLTDFLTLDYKLIDFDRQTAKDVRDFIHNLPQNRNRKKAYKDKLVRQIAKMNVPEEDVISDRTKDKYIGCYVALFGHAVAEEIVQMNYFSRLRIGEDNWADSNNTKSFNDDELFMIFNSEKSIYKTGVYTPSRYFSLIILLTSLCRVQELTQLVKSDIKKVRDIWCIDHNTDGNKKLKTGNSPRCTCIHSAVLAAGFIEYVESLDDGAPLFPELPWADRGNYHALSSWFNNTYAVNLGVKAPRKVLYSLKSTASTLLDNKDVNELTMAKIAGHKYGNIEITKTYSAGKDINVIKEAIELIDFECLKDIKPFINKNSS